MAGDSGPRNVNSRYQRAHEKRPRDPDADAEDGSSDARRQRARSSGSGSRRGRPPLVLQRDVPEEDRRTSDSSDDNHVRATDDEGEAHEGGKAGGSSTASAMARVYLRGPSKLPRPPLPPLRPVIRPHGDTQT
jgi:hypothetical protein